LQPTAALVFKPAPGIHHLRVDLYWAETRTTYFDGKIIETTGAIFKCSVDGCGDSPTVVAPGTSHADALTLDARSLYWIEDGTRIWRASK
jgi:hypothetical protein